MPWRSPQGWGWRHRRYTSPVVRAATLAALITVFAASSAAADVLRDLGDAFHAYEAGDVAGARTRLSKLAGDERLAIRDYALWLRGMVALRSGEPARAEAAFHQLARLGGSPFAREVPWRLADCAWERGDRAAAVRAYQKALAQAGAQEVGDIGTAMFRIAETRSGPAALAGYRALAIEHPSHPLAIRAEQKLTEAGAPPLSAAERIERARHLTDAHLWDEAIA